jgi:hypothetical protein
MRKFVPGMLLWALLAVANLAMADDGPTPPLSTLRQFNSGGTIHMDLSAGDYSIVAASENQIHVTGTCHDLYDETRLRADIRVQGGEAKIVTGGPHNNTHFTIEVPRHSNLVIRLSAGNLEIGKIEGDLDVSSHAGDVNIEVGRVSEYRSVNASVYAGDVTAPAFGESKSGLFRSVHWSGSGTHKIYAHVGAGDLNLQSTD